MRAHSASLHTQPGSAESGSGYERVWRLGDRDTVGAYLYGPGRLPHYASLTTASVTLGGGAGSTIVAPCFGNIDSLEWKLRYGDAAAVRFTAASVVSSYDYLVSGAITTTEAIRRLKLLRAARADLVSVAALATTAPTTSQPGTQPGLPGEVKQSNQEKSE